MRRTVATIALLTIGLALSSCLAALDFEGITGGSEMDSGECPADGACARTTDAGDSGDEDAARGAPEAALPEAAPCREAGGSCAGQPECCSGSCTNSVCQCSPKDVGCSGKEDCCSATCTNGQCACADVHSPCPNGTECCSQLTCSAGLCCLGPDYDCNAHDECCSGRCTFDAYYGVNTCE